MSKKPTQAATAQAIEHLKQRQIPLIPGTHPLPFLTEPAAFRSGAVRRNWPGVRTVN
jgi:hypothetical protein